MDRLLSLLRLGAMQISDRFGSFSSVDVSTWSQATHERNMHMAIKAARRASYVGGMSVGAVVVDSTCRLVAEGHSLTRELCDPTAHAETIAIRSAAVKSRRPHLPDMVLYTTFEPCSMCLGACAWANLGGVVFGADASVAPDQYFDDADQCVMGTADTHGCCEKNAPLFIRGRVLFEETTQLLVSEDRLARECEPVEPTCVPFAWQ
jgi:tRNA(Arg) A34 adenosine deaminase TadA